MQQATGPLTDAESKIAPSKNPGSAAVPSQESNADAVPHSPEAPADPVPPVPSTDPVGHPWLVPFEPLDAPKPAPVAPDAANPVPPSDPANPVPPSDPHGDDVPAPDAAEPAHAPAVPLAPDASNPAPPSDPLAPDTANPVPPSDPANPVPPSDPLAPDAANPLPPFDPANPVPPSDPQGYDVPAPDAAEPPSVGPPDAPEDPDSADPATPMAPPAEPAAPSAEDGKGGGKTLPVVPHEAVPEVSKGRKYNPEEHVPIESFVTTLSDWTFFWWLEQSWHLLALLQHATACDSKF